MVALRLGEHLGREHVERDGPCLDALCQLSEKRVSSQFGGKGVGGRGDALVGLQVEPLLSIGSVKSYLEVKLGMVEEQFLANGSHSLSSQENDIMTAIYRNLD